DVNLGPIVDSFVAGTRVPTGLPAGGNAVETAKCDEQESFLAAIAVLLGTAIIADVANSRVFDGVAVFDLAGDPIVEFFSFEIRVGFTVRDFFRERPDFWRE